MRNKWKVNTISKLDALVPSKLEAECLGEMILFHYPAAVVTHTEKEVGEQTGCSAHV